MYILFNFVDKNPNDIFIYNKIASLMKMFYKDRSLTLTLSLSEYNKILLLIRIQSIFTYSQCEVGTCKKAILTDFA